MARCTGSSGCSRGAMVSSRYSAIALDSNSDTESSMRSTGTFLCGEIARNQSGRLSAAMCRNSNGMFFSRSTIAARCTQGHVSKLTKRYFVTGGLQLLQCAMIARPGRGINTNHGGWASGTRLRREKPVPLQEVDHEAIEEPGLLHVAGMAGARQSPELATGDAVLQHEGAGMCPIFAPGQDHRRCGDALEMADGLGLPQRLELPDDGLKVGPAVPLAKKVGEVMRERRCAKGGAQILEGVVPAMADAIGAVGLDSAVREFLAWIVASAGEDHRRNLLGALVIEVGDEDRSDRAADENDALAAERVIDRFPARSRHIVLAKAGRSLGRAAIARYVDRDTAIPGRKMSELENPAGLIHRIGMDEGHRWPGAAHAVVIERPVHVLRHDSLPLLWSFAAMIAGKRRRDASWIWN